LPIPFRNVYRQAASDYLKHRNIEKLESDYSDSPHFSSILEHILGTQEDKIIEIPPSEGEWFSITENCEYWPAYLELLSDSERKNMAKPAVSIDTSTSSIMNRLFDPKQIQVGEINHRYGMVVGYVQSGKTAHFTGLIAKAADAGFKFVVVLSGLYNDLREQTQARLCKELTGTLEDPFGCDLRDVEFSNPWHLATEPGRGRDFHEIRERHNLEMLTDERPTLVVTKKNVSPLEGLKEWVKGLTPEQRSQIPLLVIDDECDYASINTNAPRQGDSQQRDPNRINGLLRELLSLFDNRAYIGYTASPFANVFIHPDGDGTDYKTLYPRDFVVSLPKPDGYQGFETLFPVDDSTPGPIQIVKEKSGPIKPDLEADIVRKLTDDPYADPSANMDLYPSLKEAFATYILSGSLRLIRGYENKHHSMLIHTKYTKVSMKPLQKLISSANLVWKNALKRRKPNRLSGHDLEIYEYIRDYYNLVYSTDIDAPPNWGLVHEGIRKFYRKGVRVLEINSDTDNNLNYDRYHSGLNVIAVGGNRLSRGLTLEGLCVSYFIRKSESPKADTMMQMGRWFGFRPGYSDLIRIYTTAKLNEHFDHIRQMEEFLRDEIERLEALGKTPDDFALRVMRTQKVLPTSDMKMRGVRITGHSFDNEILPKQGKFHFDRTDILTENMQHIGRQLLDLSMQPKPKGGSWIWRGVSLDWAENTIKGMKLPNDAFQIVELQRYFERRNNAGKAELSNWSVALIGLNVKNKENAKTSKIKIAGKEIYSSKRTRLKGTNSVGFFPAPSDFVIDLDKPISDFKENDKLRYSKMFQARPADQPLMLIYVIDKDSKATSNRRENLFSNGIDGEHVVAVTIALPKATITQSEKDAERLMWSNAFRETMRDYDYTEEE